MRRFVVLFFMFSAITSYAQSSWIDPFVNPIKVQMEKKISREKRKVSFPKKKAVNLFKPVIPESLENLSIQGVIGVNGKYYLVVYDPETGETFVLKKGDAISASEKITDITPNRVTIVRYVYKAGKLTKKSKVLKVNSEG